MVSHNAIYVLNVFVLWPPQYIINYKYSYINDKYNFFKLVGSNLILLLFKLFMFLRTSYAFILQQNNPV